MTKEPRYERIGHGYADRRREDPLLLEHIQGALAGCRSVANIGAGPGSYEPTDKHVVAIEPSDVMAKQRPVHRGPAVRAFADALPLHDDSVDAAMTVMSMHHWDRAQRAGILEMRRVARGPVVIVTCDPRVSVQMWLFRDYLHEVAELEPKIFPVPEIICGWLGGDCEVVVVPTPRDSPDHSLFAFWAHPEWVADPDARSATSGFARLKQPVVDRVVRDVASDLESGVWDERNGKLRDLDAYDAGLRMIVHRRVA